VGHDLKYAYFNLGYLYRLEALQELNDCLAGEHNEKSQMDGSSQKFKGLLMITHNFHRSRTSSASERQLLLSDKSAATLTSDTPRKKVGEVSLRRGSGSGGSKLLSDINTKHPIPRNAPSTISYIDISEDRHKSGGIIIPEDSHTKLGVFDSMPSVRKDSFRWLLPRAPQRRLVYKNGDCNITRANINKRGQRYLADIFTTLVDIKWRWNLLIFALAFTLSWIIFGLIWWLICFSHGDLANYGQVDWKACVDNVSDFSTALLFSIETQQTIGYGTRSMTPYCIEAIIMVMFQSCFGIIIQALMTGLVFAKLSRPKKRAQTLMFSKSALICDRDGELCLLFRVGDMRKSHIVEAQVYISAVSLSSFLHWFDNYMK